MIALATENTNSETCELALIFPVLLFPFFTIFWTGLSRLFQLIDALNLVSITT